MSLSAKIADLPDHINPGPPPLFPQGVRGENLSILFGLGAPMELRIESCRKQRGLDVAAAQRYIDHVDKAHTRRLIALFDADWKDPTRYALVLNMAQISLEAAKQAIVEMARLKEFQHSHLKASGHIDHVFKVAKVPDRCAGKAWIGHGVRNVAAMGAA